MPTLLLAAWLPDLTFRNAWRTPKLLDGSTVLMLLFAAGIFCIASLLPLVKGPRTPVRVPWPNLSGARLRRLRSASSLLFFLTLIGYTSLLISGLGRGATPGDLLGAFVGQENYSGTLKELFAPIPGVTTLTQMGIAYVTVATVLLLVAPDRRVARRLVIVVILALVRSFALTERLAILELAVPIAVILVMAWSGDARRFSRRLVNSAPLLLGPLLIVVFGAFEYSRSWVFYQARSTGSFASFAAERLAGYYATAYNNGQVGLLYDNLPGRLPLSTLEALWTAPGIDQIDLYNRLSPGSADQLYSALVQVANPEFNNPGGLSAPMVDWGVVPGIVWWAIAGLVLGVAYRGFSNASLTALMVYPPLTTGLFEIPRLVYWTQGRLLPALVGLLLTALYASGFGSRYRQRLYRRLEPVS